MHLNLFPRDADSDLHDLLFILNDPEHKSESIVKIPLEQRIVCAEVILEQFSLRETPLQHQKCPSEESHKERHADTGTERWSHPGDRPKTKAFPSSIVDQPFERG